MTLKSLRKPVDRAKSTQCQGLSTEASPDELRGDRRPGRPTAAGLVEVQARVIPLPEPGLSKRAGDSAGRQPRLCAFG